MLLNRDRAERLMAENELLALVASSPANVFYSTDCSPYGDSLAVIPLERGTEPLLVTSIAGTTPVALMSPPWFRDVRYYGEFYIEAPPTMDGLTPEERAVADAKRQWEQSKPRDSSKLLIDALMERGLTEGRVGIDESNLRGGHPLWGMIKKRLPHVVPVPAQALFKEIRMVKTSEEISRIKTATRITEKAWEASLDFIHRGITEREFADVWQTTIIHEGGQSNAYLGAFWPPVAFGRRTAFSDIAQPSNCRLQTGDIIRFDGGATYMGYPCDMARVAAYMEAGDKLKKYWHAIHAGEQKAVQMAQPGEDTSRIFDAAVDTVRREGISHYRRHHTGHGWGIEGYDPPTIGPKGVKLMEDMVLCFETPYYEVGWGGILHEDIVTVKPGGPRLLSSPEDTLRVVG